jgi:hypothetical protein
VNPSLTTINAFVFLSVDIRPSRFDRPAYDTASRVEEKKNRLFGRGKAAGVGGR